MRTILLLFITTLCATAANAQTYYWVGGTAAASAFTNNANWNSVRGSNAAGTQRTAASSSDILIFDGSDYGAGVNTGVVTATTSATTCGQIILQNGAHVSLQRITTGSGNITISGLVAGTDLLVGATDSLALNGSDPAYSTTLIMTSGATGSIAGRLYITSGASRLACNTTGGVEVENGAIVYCSVPTASAYPFGGNTGQSADKGVIFKSGSSVILRGGNSLFGNSTTFNPIVFQTGSTCIFEATNPAGMFSSRYYANILVRPSALSPATPVTVTVDNTIYNIDTLTIDPLGTFLLRPSGTAPIAGDIINNGTFGTATPITTSNMIMDGIVPQEIRGSGTFNDIGGISVATGAAVTLQHSLVLNGTSTSTITGSLNTQHYTLTGTANLQFRGASNTAFTGNTVTGDYTVTNVSNVGGMALGLEVTGPGIPANTYITATNSATFTFTMSKPATATATAVNIITNGYPATCIMANAGGVDGAIATTGTTRSFGSTTNYVFNAATTTPFTDISNPNGSSGCRNITLNAPISTNRLMTSSGVVTLNNNKFTITAGDTLRLLTSASIAGPINSNSYFVTAESGSEIGLLRIDTFSVPKTFPVGTSNYYMPVLVSPSSGSTFAVGVFEGVTENGMPDGTPFTALQKQSVVDAVWHINRLTSNNDIATINVTWPQALEGSQFTTYPDANVGLSRHDGSTWTITGGVGDNTNNNASNAYNNFSPFGVGKAGTVLPVQLSNFTAKKEAQRVLLDWTMSDETGAKKYQLERSADGSNFNIIYLADAVNAGQYSYSDNNPLTGVSYYRLSIISQSGSITRSGIQKITFTGKSGIIVLSNPVKNNTIAFRLEGWAKGKVSASVYNMAGQCIMMQEFGHNGDAALRTITLPAGAEGIYQLVLRSAQQVDTKQVMLTGAQ